MGPALVFLVLALIPSGASVRLATQSQSIAAIHGASSRTRVDTQPSDADGAIDPMALLSSPGSGVDFQLQPPDSIKKKSDRRIEAILTVEELVERDHVRDEGERHALNCHRFGNDPNFRKRMASSDHPGARATVDPHVIAVERETLDEPQYGSGGAATSGLDAPALAPPSGMGHTDLHKCLLLSYTSNRIEIKSFTNENTGRTEAMELPTFPQALGVFALDAMFHNREALAKDEFYIVIIEAIDDEAGLATCSLLGDPTGAAPGWKWSSKTNKREREPDERDYDVKGIVIPKSFRKTWVVHGESMENDVEKLAESIAAHIEKDENQDEQLKDLAEHIKQAEKRIPFNHKLETAKVTFKKCSTKKGAQRCDAAKEVKYLHDKAFTTSSEQHPTLDYVKLSSKKSQDEPLDSSPGFLFPDWARFKGSKNAEVKGSIDWHTTISSKDRCIPAMKQWFYVGVGTDADVDGNDVDLDLGIILYKKDGDGKHKRHFLFWGTKDKLEGGGRHWNQMAEYSGDNLSGAGEGDDEWMFLDLNALKADGVDVIAIMAHAYKGQKFETMRGSFARFVMGDASGSTKSEQALRWSGAETVEYVDIDELRPEVGFHSAAVLIGVLSLEAKTDLVLPKKTTEKLTPSFEKTPSGADMQYPSADGVHFNLAIKKHPSTCGATYCTLADSACDIEKKVFGMSSGGCVSNRPDVGQPIMKKTTHDDRQASLTTVESSELEQPAGEVLDPLDMLTPPIANNGQKLWAVLANKDGPPLSGQETLEAAVGQMTATMSHDEWLREMLVEFPGGPPGTDTLCTRD